MLTCAVVNRLNDARKEIRASLAYQVSDSEAVDDSERFDEVLDFLIDLVKISLKSNKTDYENSTLILKKEDVQRSNSTTIIKSFFKI